MKFIKKYKSFLEDGNASVNASTGGMGAVVSAQPGSLPGQTGTTGSGDVSFTFKKEKRKKGGPSQVTDLRDLKDVKTDKVEDINNQLQFLGKELSNSYSGVLKNLKTSKSIADSTAYVLEKFEVPATYINRKTNPGAYQATKQKRINYALSAEAVVDEVYK
jgi:hypothetical protein